MISPLTQKASHASKLNRSDLEKERTKAKGTKQNKYDTSAAPNRESSGKSHTKYAKHEGKCVPNDGYQDLDAEGKGKGNFGDRRN